METAASPTQSATISDFAKQLVEVKKASAADLNNAPGTTGHNATPSLIKGGKPGDDGSNLNTELIKLAEIVTNLDDKDKNTIINMNLPDKNTEPTKRQEKVGQIATVLLTIDTDKKKAIDKLTETKIEGNVMLNEFIDEIITAIDKSPPPSSKGGKRNKTKYHKRKNQNTKKYKKRINGGGTWGTDNRKTTLFGLIAFTISAPIAGVLDNVVARPFVLMGTGDWDKTNEILAEKGLFRILAPRTRYNKYTFDTEVYSRKGLLPEVKRKW